MIKKIYHYISENTYPYENLAVEECLLDSVEPGECILYLWQNRNTVVVGRNQNVMSEVRTELLESEGGFLVRRLSGGGAVYHDTGNLNFTFLMNREDFDVSKQVSVVLKMLERFGIIGEKTGRNDILVDGRKFSGNAYYHRAGHSYHHGTIMMDVNKDTLARYLNVPVSKLESKGVKSVRSRIVNLSELSVDITPESLRKAMIEAFEQVYELSSQELPPDKLDPEKIARLTEKFSGREWNYGKEYPFSFSLDGRFSWGNVELNPLIHGKQIKDIHIYSDAMDGELIRSIREKLSGVAYSPDALKTAFSEIEQKVKDDALSSIEGSDYRTVLSDISSLLLASIRG